MIPSARAWVNNPTWRGYVSAVWLVLFTRIFTSSVTHSTVFNVSIVFIDSKMYHYISRQLRFARKMYYKTWNSHSQTCTQHAFTHLLTHNSYWLSWHLQEAVYTLVDNHQFTRDGLLKLTLFRKVTNARVFSRLFRILPGNTRACARQD